MRKSRCYEIHITLYGFIPVTEAKSKGHEGCKNEVGRRMEKGRERESGREREGGRERRRERESSWRRGRERGEQLETARREQTLHGTCIKTS